MATNLYKRDLPNDLDLEPIVAIDTETMGLNQNQAAHLKVYNILLRHFFSNLL